VPEVQDFDHTLIFADLVVDQNRTVSEFAHARSFPYCPTHAREIGQKFYVVEERFSKTRSSLIIIGGYMPDDFSQVA
jgi:hypothetical protein